MYGDGVRVDAARPEVVPVAKTAPRAEEHPSWLSRLVADAILDEPILMDLRLSESDVQKDLTYGVD
jgi:hypothetical protein